MKIVRYLLWVLCLIAAATPSHAAKAPDFSHEVQPLLTKYCYPCHGNGKHKGDLALDSFHDLNSMVAASKTWEKVLHNLETGEMPPEGKPQPSADEKKHITQWIDVNVLKCDCDHPDAGRITIRRLNRTEYNNTIRDLVGIEFQPAKDFPADDAGYGFDNIGDVLSIPPVLMEKYLAASENIFDLAIVVPGDTNRPAQHWEAENLPGNADVRPHHHYMGLYRESKIETKFQAPREGDYILRARAFQERAGNEPARMEFHIDGKKIYTFDVTALEKDPDIYETRLHLQRGEKTFAAAYINNFRDPDNPDPEKRDRNLFIDYLEVEGPLPSSTLPETHTRIIFRQPTARSTNDTARAIIARFASRAYRRKANSSEVDHLMKFFGAAQHDKLSFEESIKAALQVVLVSPNFLFRELPDTSSHLDKQKYVSDYTLASRLSYFLWSTMPDDKLLDEAAHGNLHRNLPTEIKRMLKDPKAKALAENFATQWLQLRNLKEAAPDPELFPDFDDDLRAAMEQETTEFFSAIVREDRSVLDFLDANYTFVNARLAKHYGLKGSHSDQFDKVSLDGTHRAGIFTQGSILTLTSNPTRTSPVKRGKWVLDNILGTPPPPPPPQVPPLKENKPGEAGATLRLRLEQHRADPNCASCHARMDPLGFAFEHFDPVGRWRETDGPMKIDSAGQLITGEEFQNSDDLRKILAEHKKAEFIHCLTEKILTYALGRGLEYQDKCAVSEITKKLAVEDYKFSSLILAVANSVPFQMQGAVRSSSPQSN